jgi:hypothetical protein
MNDEDLEHTLKSLRWRSAKPEIMQRTLDAALAERRAVGQASDLAGAEHRKPQRRGLSTSARSVPRFARCGENRNRSFQGE